MPDPPRQPIDWSRVSPETIERVTAGQDGCLGIVGGGVLVIFILTMCGYAWQWLTSEIGYMYNVVLFDLHHLL